MVCVSPWRILLPTGIGADLPARVKATSPGKPGDAGLGLLLRREVVLAHTAKLAGKILGKILPLYAGFVLVIDPAADLADIFHVIFLLMIRLDGKRPVRSL